MIHQLEKLVDICFASIPRTRPTLADNAIVRLVAHRGAHDVALKIQENTLDAFNRAWQLGCYGIEFDVHACKDDVLVVNHDATLKRLWGHDVAICDLEFEQLHKLVPELPTLEQVITRYGKRMHLFIELKAPFTAELALAKVLKQLEPCNDYHFLSLDETLFPTMQRFPKPAMLLVPIYDNVHQFCSLSLKHGYGGVLGHYVLFTNKKIQSIVDAGQIAGVGIVDSKYSLYRELHRGLDLIFTNQAAALVNYIQELQQK